MSGIHEMHSESARANCVSIEESKHGKRSHLTDMLVICSSEHLLYNTNSHNDACLHPLGQITVAYQMF